MILGSLPLMAGTGGITDNAVGVNRINQEKLGNPPSDKKDFVVKAKPIPAKLVSTFTTDDSTSEPPKKDPPDGSKQGKVTPPMPDFGGDSSGTNEIGRQWSQNPITNTDADQLFEERSDEVSTSTGESQETVGEGRSGLTSDEEGGSSTSNGGSEPVDSGPPPASYALLERRPDFNFHQPSLLFRANDSFTQGQKGLGVGPGLLGDSIRYVPIGEF